MILYHLYIYIVFLWVITRENLNVREGKTDNIPVDKYYLIWTKKSV